MKKLYSKPFLAVESFQLNAALAAGCNVKLGHGMEGCTLVDEAGTLVAGEVLFGDACESKLNEIGQDNNGICYHSLTYDYTTVYLES